MFIYIRTHVRVCINHYIYVYMVMSIYNMVMVTLYHINYKSIIQLHHHNYMCALYICSTWTGIHTKTVLTI